MGVCTHAHTYGDQMINSSTTLILVAHLLEVGSCLCLTNAVVTSVCYDT